MSHPSPYSCPAIREDIDFKVRSAILSKGEGHTRTRNGFRREEEPANRIRKSVADESTI